MSTPKRIYQIAKQINISHQEIVSFLREKGFEIRNHMDVVESSTFDLILKHFAADLYQLEIEKKEDELRIIEEARRTEEEERIQRTEIEKKKREDEENAKKETEILRLREVAIARKKLEEEEKLKFEKEKKQREEAEQIAQEILDKESNLKKKSTKTVANVEKDEVVEAPVKSKIVAHKIERKIKKVIKDTHSVQNKNKKTHKVDDKKVQENIKKTISSFEEKKRRKKRGGQSGEEGDSDALDIFKVTEFIALHEFADLIEIDISDLIGKCMEMGMMVTINQRIDRDTIELLAGEFEVNVEFQDEIIDEAEEEFEEEETGTLQPRPPVITIMGHVDHGKTSLLDYIRSTNVIAGEAGGITQHIGAYCVVLPDGKELTFLDTPGHEAFTAMRARGAQVTDIVIIVVAADDAVMPQTVEAINHARAASVPIIFAINKIDKAGADTERVRRELAEHDMLVESWGGKYPDIEISAKFGNNVSAILDQLILEAEMLELTANPDTYARGIVIESRLDKGLGSVATVLIQRGTARVGDPFVCGDYSGKVRALINERNARVKIAGPSTPIEILGFGDVPKAGDKFIVMESEKRTKEVSAERQQIRREQDFKRMRHQTLDQISQQIAEGKVKDLNIVIKGDVDGSIEALADSLMKMATKEVAVRIIHRGIGMIKESDVLLASASKAFIIGFNVKADTKAKLLAKAEDVDIRHYSIIYDAVDEIKAALEGMLEPEKIETPIGTAEVLNLFKIPKIGIIAGCKVTSGFARRELNIRVVRDDEVIHSGVIKTLKRFKDEVKEVPEGNECGIAIKDWDRLKVGDELRFHTVVEKKRKLESSQ